MGAVNHFESVAAVLCRSLLQAVALLSWRLDCRTAYLVQNARCVGCNWAQSRACLQLPAMTV